MVASNSLNELYIKYTLIFAIILFSLGIIGSFLYSKNQFLLIVFSSFIQIGITLVIVDFVIKGVGNKLLQEQIMEGFRKILGIENPDNKLLPELIGLLRPHPYHVLSMNSKYNLFYSQNTKNKDINMDILEESSITVQAKEDNVQYHFYRGSTTSEINKFNLKEIWLDGAVLDPEKDLIKSYNEDQSSIDYILKYKFKRGKTYTIKMIYYHPSCMSDLNNQQIKEDYFQCKFIELTNKSKNTFVFPFELKDYIFMARRIDACQREHLIKFKKNNKTISIEEENLNNGEFLKLIYKKI